MRLYDSNVNMATLTGANRDYILNLIPHISRLMVPTVEEVMAFAETVVIGNESEEFNAAITSARPVQVLVVFVGASSRPNTANYDGICW